jgi:hypothetical protein
MDIAELRLKSNHPTHQNTHILCGNKLLNLVLLEE